MKFIYSLVTAALVGLAVAPLPTMAQSIASKIENQGDARYVKVTGLMAKERNGFLTLQMELTNIDNDPQRVFWRVKWLDDTGFQVWDDEPWKPALIQAGAKQNVQAMAPTPKAKDFLIQFNAESNRRNTPSTNSNDLPR